MSPRDFYLLVNSLPKVERVIGYMADGTPLTVTVGSLFANEADK